MKKLTCGMFAAILGLCTAGAANAQIASQGYVDQQTGALGSLTTTNQGNLVSAINEVNAAVGAIETSTADLSTVKDQVKTNKKNIATLNGDASVDGSVANKIAGALGNYMTKTETTTAIESATTDMATNASVNTAITNATSTLATKTEIADMQTTTNMTKAATATTTDKGSDTKYTSVAAAEAIANAAVATVTTDVSDLQDAVANTYDKTTADGRFQAKTDSTVATGTYNYITAGTGVAANLTALDTGTKAAKDAADAAKTAADGAQTTANEAKTAAATAQSTADTAKSDAATAQTTANAAKTTAEAAIPNVSATGDDGVYTLTAVKSGDVTTYKWELIARATGEVASGN